MGLRRDWLGTERLSWRDLLVVVNQAPPGSAIVRAVDPDGHGWGASEYLAARAVDALEWLVWAKTEDGQQNRNHPTPAWRPSYDDTETDASPVITALPMDEALQRLRWLKEAS